MIYVCGILRLKFERTFKYTKEVYHTHDEIPYLIHQRRWRKVFFENRRYFTVHDRERSYGGARLLEKSVCSFFPWYVRLNAGKTLFAVTEQYYYFENLHRVHANVILLALRAIAALRAVTACLRRVATLCVFNAALYDRRPNCYVRIF